MIGHWHVVVAAASIAVAMVISAVGGRRSPAAAVTLGVLAFAWFGIDQAFEGRVLFGLDAGHGLTQADLVGVAALVVSAVELTSIVWRRRPRRVSPSARPAPERPTRR